MQIKHLAIKNFRGIKELEWHVGGRTICLIGPGDSTKTTILDAVEFALSPARNAQVITDTDFYGLEVKATIIIEVTVAEPPGELTSEDKYGLYLRGYICDKPILNDPEDGSTPVLTIRFEVGPDLDPHWDVVKPTHDEAKPIYDRDRARFGMARLGEDANRDLTWARGSALMRITEHQRVSRASFVPAIRAAAETLDASVLEPLDGAAGLARQALTEFGVSCSDLRPSVDMHGMRFTSGVLALHDGSTPLRAAGLGTRRLACLAIQRRSVTDNGIILVDEVEYGLEPHRIRQLLKRICSLGGQSIGQVILTTHSPTPVYALPIDALRFVRSGKGITEVHRASTEIQGIVRSADAGLALLGRKIIVCEGKTEEALCRALDDAWETSHEGQSLAYHGVVAVNGNGRNSGPKAALAFRCLGYEVLYFGDSDEPIDPDENTLRRRGVEVVLWSDRCATEERITADIPLDRLDAFVKAACEQVGQDRVLDQIGNQLGENLHRMPLSVDAWRDKCTDEGLRAAIGKAAKKGAWFKNLNAGDVLGRIVVDVLPHIGHTPLARSIRRIEVWVHGQ